MRSRIFLMSSILFIFYSCALFAQPGNNGIRVYDVNTVITISGEIQSIDKTTGQNGGGVHLTFKTSEGDFEIHLGPQWYLDEQSVKLNINDNVSITGSKVASSTIIARDITKNNEKLVLRGDDGIPLWSGKRNK